MARPFLTARWSNLCILSWPVAPELLRPHLPDGLELDRREGRCWASVVAFQFHDTRVYGVPWPWHRDFPECNLRFYVREGERRGVVFVRELVPRPIIAWIARWRYHEPYATARFHSALRRDSGVIEASHRIRWRGCEHRIAVRGRLEPFLPAEDSFEHWIKEHSWGYGRGRGGRLLRYEVRHPVWQVHPVTHWDLELDWGALYGPEWAALTGRAPESVVLAVGSEVSVGPPGKG